MDTNTPRRQIVNSYLIDFRTQQPIKHTRKWTDFPDNYRKDFRKDNYDLVGYVFTDYLEDKHTEDLYDASILDYFYRKDEWTPVHQYWKAKLFHKLEGNLFKIECIDWEITYNVKSGIDYVNFMQMRDSLKLIVPEHIITEL